MRNTREKRDLSGPRPIRLRWLLIGAAATAILSAVILSVATGFNRTTARIQARIDVLMSRYDERTVYRIEKNLMANLKETRDQARAGRLNLFLGELQFVKSLHNDPHLRDIYLDAAIRYFGKTRLSPDNRLTGEALFWTGLCFYQKGEFYYPTAINRLIEALRGGFPDKLKILKILNYIYLKNRDFDVIIKINQEFLKNGYYDGDLIYSLARAYRELQRPREAAEVLGLVDRLDPVRDRHILRYILFDLAEVRFELGDFGSAAEAYERCIRTAPDPENDELAIRSKVKLAVCRNRETGAKAQADPAP